ncbi:histidine phosphatase family protein [Halomonas sp. DP8Y7-3]|uniref:histidine phosphatase family protein n=1 Tax=Halomonas sp. DP8Y7-3 TaxID=2859079 RepID=UPI001C97207B|nr:histidine phosphatase family protein [Halomonas sp. DP8Y7-3]MBY5931257.1 histidine phosphatase family protein [Halomonas sp. DP8Y7-3]
MASDSCLELVVVRHGLTQWNLDKRYQGQRDIPLLMPDALGDMDRLRDELADEVFDAVVASDLTRCCQTLAHIAEGRVWPAPRLDLRLRENDFGEFEGRQWEELKDDPVYRDWIDSAGELAPPGGESAQDLRERLALALDAIFDAAVEAGHRRVLVVTHGGVIRELRREFEGVPFWQGVVGQAAGRRWTLTRQAGEITCTSSSAVPTVASTSE